MEQKCKINVSESNGRDSRKVFALSRVIPTITRGRAVAIFDRGRQAPKAFYLEFRTLELLSPFSIGVDSAIGSSLFDLLRICFRFFQLSDIFVRRSGLEAFRKEAVCEEEGA